MAEPRRVTLRFADGRIMMLSLDLTDELAAKVPPVVYLGEEEGQEVLDLLRAWFPSSFTPEATQRQGSTRMGAWWAGPHLTPGPSPASDTREEGSF